MLLFSNLQLASLEKYLQHLHWKAFWNSVSGMAWQRFPALLFAFCNLHSGFSRTQNFFFLSQNSFSEFGKNAFPHCSHTLDWKDVNKMNDTISKMSQCSIQNISTLGSNWCFCNDLFWILQIVLILCQYTVQWGPLKLFTVRWLTLCFRYHWHVVRLA